MEKVWLNGNLTESPFPYLLSRVWSSKRTGHLDIKKNDTSKKIEFFEGDIIVSSSMLDYKIFSRFLQNEKQISPSNIKKCQNFAKSQKTSLIKALIELNIVSSLMLWESLELFFINEILPLFDWEKAEYFFDSAQEQNKSEILVSISTPKIIRKGIYHMKNHDIINSHMPSSDESIHIYPNKSFLNSELNSNEIYLLNLIKDKIKLNDLYQISEMGKKETNRMIYLFQCLKIAGPSRKTLNHITQELSKVELNHILESFNKKCFYIFKYISKEIGPVAASVLEKCLKDAKANLPPQLQNISLSQDGTVYISSTPSTNPSLPGEIKGEDFLKALNEILNAELLTVKKTLGNEHESRVAKNLKKIGKWNSKKTKS